MIKEIKFGGYINNKWSHKGGWVKNDEDCFLFLINQKKIYNPVKNQNKYCFGENLVFSEFGIKNDIFEKSCLNIFKKDRANSFFTNFETDYEITGGESEFIVKELEVFQIISII